MKVLLHFDVEEYHFIYNFKVFGRFLAKIHFFHVVLTIHDTKDRDKSTEEDFVPVAVLRRLLGKKHGHLRFFVPGLFFSYYIGIRVLIPYMRGDSG
ncbi:MAG: hypothetical protein J1E01_05880 [Acetatifactor sp.]|nr:hypothetical protein [Acetatifactor sp.]